MTVPRRSHLSRGLLLFATLPFLMGFEPRRDEGFTVGLGGGAGRGHYTTACSQQGYQQEFAAAAVALDYTFAHDSARVYRPRVTVGGLLAAAGTDTRLVYDSATGLAGSAANEEDRERQAAIANLLLHLDWTYVGLGAGIMLTAPGWHQGNMYSNAFPLVEVRLGPWEHVYMTTTLGGGFALPVPVPFDIAFGWGWQGSEFGAWLGHALTPYESAEHLLSLSYRLRSVTLLGSAGLFAEDNGFTPEYFERGEFSRLALGLRFKL